jgi:hypothetical protein
MSGSLQPSISRRASTNSCEPETIGAVERWRSGRSRDRPFFLFVNVSDAHWPYATSEGHQGQRFVPLGTEPETARRLDLEVDSYICRDPVPAETFEILRGLYHGGVAEADAKLAEVLALLAGERPGETVVVTSDHGEHFGERGLVSHQFSLAEPLLHVPLVVHGLAGVSPATIEEPVQLADIAPSVLEWAVTRKRRVRDDLPDHLEGIVCAAVGDDDQLAAGVPLAQVVDDRVERLGDPRLFVVRRNDHGEVVLLVFGESSYSGRCYNGCATGTLRRSVVSSIGCRAPAGPVSSHFARCS